MPDSLSFSAHPSHKASPPPPLTLLPPSLPQSSAFLSPGVAPSTSRPASPSGIIDHQQYKANIIAKGKLKAKDPPSSIQSHLPRSPFINAPDSPPSSTSSKHESPIDYPTTAELHLDQYVTRDLLHSTALISQGQAQHDLIRSKRKEIEFYHTLRRERTVNPGAVFGYGYQGYGNGFTNGKSRILYPCERKKPGARKSRELRIPRTLLQTQAEEGECLVPIRLEIDYEKIKLRDTFTWNLHDRTVPIELFAEQLVEDFHLPLATPLIKLIAKQIADQVTDFYPHVHLPDEPLDPKLPYWAYKNDEMRILIKINITIGAHTLVDQFEWDINNPVNSPEGFAKQMAIDMCLSGEFTTAIAHSIREQCQLYTKYLYQTGHTFDGRPVEDPELKSAMLASPLPAIMRPTAVAKEHAPILYELSDGELEKVEKSLSRESRRKRRVNRRGGPSLPDLKEMPKTNRSQIVSSVLPGAVLKVSDMKLTSDKPKEPDSEEESDSDTPPATPPPVAPSLLNTMTRRQRGAAVNAAAALRASAGRSATPELSQLHHIPHHLHTPSSSHVSRRPGLPFNVESAVVKLKIPRDKLLRWTQKQQRIDLQNSQRERAEAKALWDKQQREKQLQAQQQRERLAAAGSSSTPAPEVATMPVASKGAAAAPASSVGESSASAKEAPNTPTPAASKQRQASPPTSQQQNGNRTEPANPPPTPDWLIAGLDDLRLLHPNDNFEGIMRYTAVDGITEQPITGQNPASDPDNIKHKFFPRIRCHDCPGKLYTPGPDISVDNFKLHLMNRGHRQRVEERVKRAGAATPSAG
ncbi:hypothetical protein DFH27DRAFT_16703 [Peziza echinospora]|nr:hypothetical protein DFH27DRAFT_16703 [Peziza echinospora]